MNTGNKPKIGVPVFQNNDLEICLTNSTLDVEKTWTAGLHDIRVYGQAAANPLGPNSAINITGTGRILYNVFWTNGLPMTDKFNYDYPGNDFTGELIVNSGKLATTGGRGFTSISNLVSTGKLIQSDNALSPMGGYICFGSGSSSTTVIGNLFPTNWVVKGGKILAGVNKASGWTDEVRGYMNSLRFSDGFVNIYRESNWSNRLDVAELSRSGGAAVFFFDKPNSALILLRIYVENIQKHLKGSGGAPGSKNMSIIPWMTVRNVNASSYKPQIFATYDEADGIRMIDLTSEVIDVNTSPAAEFAAAGDGDNIYFGSYKTVNLSADKTVNSVWLNNAGKIYPADGVTLTVSSGAIGGEDSAKILGKPNTGRICFGDSEGVIWSGGSAATFTIVSCLAGTNGLTVTQNGTVIINGTNTLTGPVYISGGTMQFGDGTRFGSFVSKEYFVQHAGTLRIKCENPIPPKADIVLSGINEAELYPAVDIDAGLVVDVGTLMYNGVYLPTGTYGSASSEADYKDDRFFLGEGMLKVKRLGGVQPTMIIVR